MSCEEMSPRLGDKPGFPRQRPCATLFQFLKILFRKKRGFIYKKIGKIFLVSHNIARCDHQLIEFTSLGFKQYLGNKTFFGIFPCKGIVHLS